MHNLSFSFAVILGRVAFDASLWSCETKLLYAEYEKALQQDDNRRTGRWGTTTKMTLRIKNLY